MDEIINYKLKDFKKQSIELMIEYINILQLIEPQETKQEIFYMKLREVDYIKKSLGSEDDDELVRIVAMVEEMTEIQVNNLPIVTFFGLFKSIREQTLQIVEAEENGLVSNNPNVKWELVEGGRRMGIFGIYNTLDQLSNGDITKYNEILELPYNEVFTKLRMDKIKGDLQQEMDAIKLKTD